MATLFNSYSFCDGIIASGKLCDYEHFLITVLFVKTKGMSVKKFALLLRSILYFSAVNILRFFKNGSRRTRINQNDIKFMFCMEICFSGLLYP